VESLTLEQLKELQTILSDHRHYGSELERSAAFTTALSRMILALHIAAQEKLPAVEGEKDAPAESSSRVD
jgi:hypothetical protein